GAGSLRAAVNGEALGESGKFGAVGWPGCGIQGETEPNVYIKQQGARGIAEVGLRTGVPTIFGVITPSDLEQALARAGEGSANKGYEVTLSAITMANLNRRLPEL